MGHRVRTGDGIIGASLRRVAIGGSNGASTLLPSSSTEWVVWKDCEFLKNEKCEKGFMERKRELSSVGICKGFEFGRGRNCTQVL